ncbi:hypothetical protein LC048_11660 [Mesobacillus subterraneus]|nr:hypothetical protein [Mesobacillus subterraneus]WLR57446.1 hypothetical protein LC048_11660 [Mesobacillus subterraneus]
MLLKIWLPLHGDKERHLNMIPGVVENGVFVHMVYRLITVENGELIEKIK